MERTPKSFKFSFFRGSLFKRLSLRKNSLSAIMFSITIVLLFSTFVFAADPTADSAPRIRLNTVGYFPDAEKKASIFGECREFVVRHSKDGVEVFRGAVGEPIRNADTKEKLFIADFSAVKAPGEYRLEAEGVGRSADFRIASDVYDEPFKVVLRSMYLWRCGKAVSATYKGVAYSHPACHTEDAWTDFVNGRHEKQDGVGGWHDAGDYNKYVVNAGVTVGVMLRAWDDFRIPLSKVRIGTQSGDDKTPDYLAEIRWELDWLLKMQADDGSVYHKLSTKTFGGFISPEKEKTERFFTPWGSAATADFAAITAMASRYYREYDAAFADRCLAASQKAYAFLQSHPENHNADQRGFSTGAYDTKDADDRLWAAVELWETTGDANFLRDAEARIEKSGAWFDHSMDWGEVKNLGQLTYLFSKKDGRNSALVQKLRSSLLYLADELVKERDVHGYARPFGEKYFWGCNGAVARQTTILQAAYRATNKSVYRDVAIDEVNHLFGRNCFGRSFVTGLGDHPPLHPHDRRCEMKGEAWPGYLVGGPRKNAFDWRDVQGDYETNEIAINWNAGLIYALAGFLESPK